MKVAVLQENLAQGLTVISRIVSSKAQLPVLSNVLIATDQGRLKLSATNLETGINLWIGAKIEQQGSISIPAKILNEYIASLPPQKIDLEVKENSLSLKGAAFQATLIGLPASEFPAIPSLEGKPEVNLAIKDLASAISQVAFAATQDEGRPVLTGILVKVKDNALLLVGTDGYRLSLRKIIGLKGIEEVKQFQEGLIIPARTLTEVAKIVETGQEKNTLGLTITPQSNQVIFSTTDYEVVSRLIEGKFPDFEKIIPEKGTTRLVIDKENFHSAIRTAAIFARESANIVKLEIENGKVKVSANAAQVGDNLTEIEAKTEGETTKIAFNSRYLLDLLNSINAELINFEMTSPLNPGVFRPAEDNSFLHIIMPVRVQE